jgi:hypothetical protein
MNKADFFDRFIMILKNTKEKYDLDSIHDGFIVWLGENFFLLDPLDVKDRIVKDSHAEGIDAVLLNQSEYEICFIQAKTVEAFKNTAKNFPENELKNVLEGVRFLLRGNYKGKITSELENIVDEYHDLDQTGDYVTKIYFFALKQAPVDMKYVEEFKKDFNGIQIKYFGFDEIFDFFVNKYLILRSPPPDRISFEVMSNLLEKDLPSKSRVFIIKGKELAKVYNDHKERIFQQNVRYSLGVRSRSINRQIAETAINKGRGPFFWYFNNGITIVCNKIKTSTSGKVINLFKPQIINGAQTTYALYEGYKEGKLNEDVEVLIKVIETDDKHFIEKVTLYTNSQNAIRLRDLCSNDDIQDKIQKLMLSSYRFFYERKRGEFVSLYRTEESKESLLGKDFRTRIIDNENVAQCMLAFYLQKPSQAKAEKARIFLKDKIGFYDDIFNKNDDLLTEKILLSWKLFKFIDGKRSEYRKEYRKAETLAEKNKEKIYRYDYLLHSEFFILNLFVDFIEFEGYDIGKNRDHILKVIELIDGKDKKKIIEKSFMTIKDTFADYAAELKKKPNYYHNKFFKNEKSIALVRNFFNREHKFVKVLNS